MPLEIRTVTGGGEVFFLDIDFGLAKLQRHLLTDEVRITNYPSDGMSWANSKGDITRYTPKDFIDYLLFTERYFDVRIIDHAAFDRKGKLINGWVTIVGKTNTEIKDNWSFEGNYPSLKTF